MGLDEEQEAEIRADILYFLYRNNYWQKRHTPKTNICNKLSQHPCKEINTGLKKLYKDKLIRYKKTNHGDDVIVCCRYWFLECVFFASNDFDIRRIGYLF